MLKNNKINIYGCLLKLIYTPVFATKKAQHLLGFFSLQKPCFGSKKINFLDIIWFCLKFLGGKFILTQFVIVFAPIILSVYRLVLLLRRLKDDVNYQKDNKFFFIICVFRIVSQDAILFCFYDLFSLS